MARWPLPSMYAFGELELQGDVFDDGAQYVSSSLLPQPPPPVSYVQFAELIGLLAAPLNSSHQFVVHVMEPVGGVVPHCAAADFGIAERRTPNTRRKAEFITLRGVTGFTSAEMESLLGIETHSPFFRQRKRYSWCIRFVNAVFPVVCCS